MSEVGLGFLIILIPLAVFCSLGMINPDIPEKIIGFWIKPVNELFTFKKGGTELKGKQKNKMNKFTSYSESISITSDYYQDPECWYELETGEKVKNNFVWEISKMFRALEGELRWKVYIQKENWFRSMENNDIKGVRLIGIGKLNKIKYVVSDGDNLSSLAVKFNTTSRKIAEANNIPNIHRIQTGQILDIEYIVKDKNSFYNEKLHALLVAKKEITIFCPESDQQLTLDYGNFLRFCLFLREEEIQEEINAENKRAEEIKQQRLEENERKKDIIRDKHALATRFMQQQLMDDNVKSLDDMPLLLRKDFEIYAEILNSIQSERIKKDLERLKIKGDTQNDISKKQTTGPLKKSCK